jgi:hypothetical protein
MPAYNLTDDEKERLEKVFTYHPPKPDQIPRYEGIRYHAKLTALDIMENVPPSRERSLALTSIETAVFWANAAIARNE